MSSSLSLPLIHLEKVSYQYTQDTPLFSPLSLELALGEVLVLFGPSGSGKTTFLKILGNLLIPNFGKRTWYLPDKKRTQIFGYAFPHGPFFEFCSAEQNIRFLTTFTHIKLDESFFTQLIERFALKDCLKKPMNKLSAGQRERVNIVRSLIHKPKILILDEPGIHLNEALFQILFTCLEELVHQKNTLICIATHSNKFKKIASKTLLFPSL